MDSDDQIEALEEQIAELLNRRDPVSDLGIRTAKDLFAIHRVDDILAELSMPAEVGSRGSDQLGDSPGDPLHFAAAGVTLTVSRQAGRVHVTLVAADAALALEGQAGSVAIPLDNSGGGSAPAEGAVRLRVTRSGHADVVTESFVVERPPK